MALNFPNSPAVNQSFSSGVVGWTWDGAKWFKSEFRMRQINSFELTPLSAPYIYTSFSKVSGSGENYGRWTAMFRRTTDALPNFESEVVCYWDWRGLEMLNNQGASSPYIKAPILHATASGANIVTGSTTKINNLNSDYVDGYHADESATASTVAARTSGGVVNATSFNASSGDNASDATHYIFMGYGGDGLYRRKTLANVKAEIVTGAAINAAIGNTGGRASLAATLANNASSTVAGSGDVACGLLIIRDANAGGVAMLSIDPGIAAVTTIVDPSAIIGGAKWDITTSGNNVVITNKWGASRTHKSQFISSGGSVTFS